MKLLPEQKILVVIVTHNSKKFIQWAISGISDYQGSVKIIIVDSGSKSTEYLEDLESPHEISVTKQKNIGFVAANNLALQDIEGFEWVLFLNPDARIEAPTLEKLIKFASSPAQERTGVFSLPLIRFDISIKKSLGIYDSIGISRDLFGRWHDVASGKPIYDLQSEHKDFMAACGALMLVRKKALLECRDSSGKIGFERKFLMYKEDIEICLRFKKKGWKTVIYNKESAHHCRGWNDRRSKTPKWARHHSAKNDLYIAKKYSWRSIPFSASKMFWVKNIERCEEQNPS